jgi:CheY-like chemotaxis protein
MSSKQIVVVDEDPTFLELIDLLLTTHGYATICCAHGTEAYATIRQTMPALIILDIQHAGDDENWTVLDLVRLDPATTHIPAGEGTVLRAALHRDPGKALPAK